jgi:hypothetical protein
MWYSYRSRPFEIPRSSRRRSRRLSDFRMSPRSIYRGAHVSRARIAACAPPTGPTFSRPNGPDFDAKRDAHPARVGGTRPPLILSVSTHLGIFAGVWRLGEVWTRGAT